MEKRARGQEGRRERQAGGSAKVQTGAELLCKSAKVYLGVGVGTGVGVGKPFGCLEVGTRRRRVRLIHCGRDTVAPLPKIQLCRDAVPTLPNTAAGTWSRLPKAERPIPERLMPRWPSPVTRKNNAEAYFPVSGLPLSERVRCHRIPTRCIPCQRINSSTCQLTVHLPCQLANWSTGQLTWPLYAKRRRAASRSSGVSMATG